MSVHSTARLRNASSERDGSDGTWHRGYILFLRGQTLMAQPFDLRSLEPQSEPTPLVDGMGLGSMTGSGFSVSRDGTIVFRQAQPDPTQLVWYGRDGSRLAAAGQPGSYRQVALSARGQQVAVSRRDPATGNLNIYTLDLSTGVMSPQTTARSIDGDPRWSPDDTNGVVHVESDRLDAPLQRIENGSPSNRLSQRKLRCTWQRFRTFWKGGKSLSTAARNRFGAVTVGSFSISR